MSSTKQWLVLCIVASSILLVTMDLGILFVALPALSADLGATVKEQIWIINAYTLLIAGLLPVCGSLGDRKGHRRVYLFGMIVFGVASLLCALSPSPEALIASRALLAVGAASMLPSTMPIIRKTFETEQKRALALGIWSAMAAGGAAAGPVLGGFLLNNYWWGSVFMVNVPIVIIGLLFAFPLIPQDSDVRQGKIDLVGAFLVVVGLSGPMYTVSSLSSHGAGDSNGFLVPALTFLVGAIALIAFVRRARNSDAPLVDLSLLRNRRFASAVLAGGFALLSIAGFQLVMIQKMQYVNGLSPLWSSLYIFPIPLVALFAGAIAGWAIPKLGYLRVLIGATGLCGGGLVGAVLLVDSTSYAIVAIPLSIAGFGLGAVMTAASNIVMNSVPRHQIGSAASLQQVAYQIGHGLGVGLLGTMAAYLYGVGYREFGGNTASAAAKGIDQALELARSLGEGARDSLLGVVHSAFDNAFFWTALATGLGLLLAALALGVALKRETMVVPVD